VFWLLPPLLPRKCNAIIRKSNTKFAHGIEVGDRSTLPINALLFPINALQFRVSNGGCRRKSAYADAADAPKGHTPF